jgi:feruloyl esterase
MMIEMRSRLVSAVVCLAIAAPLLADAARCRALKGIELAQDGTLVKVWGPFTNFVEAASDGNQPAYCQVTGYVAPNVGFEIRLPSENWNGKLLALGCGGDCGFINAGACRGPLQRGYACIATDTGHRGQGGVWAYNDLEALTDFAYRAIHVVAIAGKEIVKKHYGSAPKHSYFFGCSTGGRQALIEAQRFPWDFDGIIAGAPWIDDSDAAAYAIWAARALREGGLSQADLQRVHDAALAACDLDDGVKDGVIGNPARCAFDPRTSGLTAAKADAVRKVYQGLDSGGAMPGSELNWLEGFAENEAWAQIWFRYMTLPPAGPQWSVADFDFDRDPKRFASGAQESLFNAANPDLRRFRAAGGKLLIYQGWNDESTTARRTIDYYETAGRVLGGGKAARDTVSLFLVPGMNHCGGGDGAYAIDYLSALEAWVERGVAPDVLIGAHPKEPADSDATSYAPLLRKFPLDPSEVAFTRRVFPYEAGRAGSPPPRD